MAIMYPTGTVATGSDTGAKLYHRGFVKIAVFGRYGITPEGAEAIKQYPESNWKLPQEKPRGEWRR